MQTIINVLSLQTFSRFLNYFQGAEGPAGPKGEDVSKYLANNIPSYFRKRESS